MDSEVPLYLESERGQRYSGWSRSAHTPTKRISEHRDTISSPTVLETKAGLSVRDRQLLVRTRNFLHISLQIDVGISQNSDQDRQLFQLSPEHWSRTNDLINMKGRCCLENRSFHPRCLLTSGQPRHIWDILPKTALPLWRKCFI